MKNKKYIWFALIIVITVLVLVIFGMKYKTRLRIGENEKIIGVSISSNKDNQDLFKSITEKSEIEFILDEINGAYKTHMISIHDRPLVKEWIEINLYAKEKQFKGYIYSLNDKEYIELPYEGIYSLKKGVYQNLILKYEIANGIILDEYIFEKCIFMHPLSSYYPFEGTNQIYKIANSYFEIIDEESNETVYKTDKVKWEGVWITDEYWKSLFDTNNLIVPIDDIKEEKKMMYIINEDYRIFIMNDKYWLVKMNRDNIYFIYQIS